jgi:DNA repair exonuclease SbcCD ATPase subunit
MKYCDFRSRHAQVVEDVRTQVQGTWMLAMQKLRHETKILDKNINSLQDVSDNQIQQIRTLEGLNRDLLKKVEKTKHSERKVLKLENEIVENEEKNKLLEQAITKLRNMFQRLANHLKKRRVDLKEFYSEIKGEINETDDMNSRREQKDSERIAASVTKIKGKLQKLANLMPQN